MEVIMPHVVNAVITCKSDDYTEKTTYENVVNCISELDVHIPAFRILKSKEINPKTVKLFRSQKTSEMYSNHSVLSWNIIEIITFHPIYRTKTKYYYYIENSDHVVFNIHIDKIKKREYI